MKVSRREGYFGVYPSEKASIEFILDRGLYSAGISDWDLAWRVSRFEGFSRLVSRREGLIGMELGERAMLGLYLG